LKRSWVINFPQGTTKPFAPGRKGTAFLIKQTKPIVIPIIVSGFNVAFDKKGLRLRKEEHCSR
jgi:1-acyl-sn-glycerol-3-phosphate acyltransferase